MSSADLVRRFRLGRLDRGTWTHEAHLTVGLWALIAARATHPPTAGGHAAAFAATLADLRVAIRTHNERIGITNSAISGYHETLTWFYLDRIALLVDRSGVDAATITRAELDRLTQLVVADPSVSRSAAVEAYAAEVLASPQARASIMAPAATLDDVTTSPLSAAA